MRHLIHLIKLKKKKLCCIKLVYMPLLILIKYLFLLTKIVNVGIGVKKYLDIFQ